MTQRDAEQREAQRRATARAERGRQVRGLLWLAAVVMGLLLVRARPLFLFHPGWWRP